MKLLVAFFLFSNTLKAMPLREDLSYCIPYLIPYAESEMVAKISDPISGARTNLPTSELEILRPLNNSAYSDKIVDLTDFGKTFKAQPRDQKQNEVAPDYRP